MLSINGWVVCPDTCLLSCAEESKKLSPRCMDVLCYLAEHPGEVISTHELLDKFWLRSSASDHAVHNVLASLRHAFGEDASNPQIFRTYPKRGYALIAKVEEISPEPSQTSEITESTQPGFYSVPVLAFNKWFAVTASKLQWWLLAVSTVVAISVVFLVYGPSSAEVGSLHVEFQHGEQISPDADYLERGFDNSLVGILSKFPDLHLGFSGKHALFDLNLPELDKDQAEYLLSVRTKDDGAGISVSLSLTETRTSKILVLDALQITADNFMAQQQRLLSDLESALRIYLDPELKQDMYDGGTRNAIAYDSFIKAEFYAQQYNHNDWDLAVEHYEKAIAEDPLFTNAYVGLGSAINLMAVYSSHEKNTELKNKVISYCQQLEILVQDHPAIDRLKSLALNIDGVNQEQLETKYRQRILEGEAPDYVFAQYALFLVGARLYEEAGMFLELAYGAESFDVSRAVGVNDNGLNLRTLMLTPWEMVPAKKTQLYDRPDHIGVHGILIYSLALMGELDEAEYYLRRQTELDKEGIRNHLGRILVSTASGELSREYYLARRAEAGLSLPEVNASNLLSGPNVEDTNLRFNNGVLQFIIGNLEEGAAHWRKIQPTDKRSLYTRLHSLEPFFSPLVLNDPGYADLLEEIGIGRSWQHRLIEGVTEMESVTGVAPSIKALAALEQNQLMLANNRWQEEDWQKLDELRQRRTEQVHAKLKAEGVL